MNSGYFGFLNIIVINIVEWLFDYLILYQLLKKSGGIIRKYLLGLGLGFMGRTGTGERSYYDIWSKLTNKMVKVKDPFFRMGRDVAARLKFPKPSLIFSSFLPSLQGAQSKMASSDTNSCIYITDSPAAIKKKVI